jgi:adenylate kinase
VNIILVGAQGSGKGTQAEKLTGSLGVSHVASGDMFRKAWDEKTELGIKAKAYIDRGNWPLTILRWQWPRQWGRSLDCRKR